MPELIEGKYYTIEEYFALDEASEAKYEYISGRVKMMTGGSLNHSTISVNTIHALLNFLNSSDRGCQVFNSDARVWIESAQSYVYPDVSLVCGPVEADFTQGQAITNPILIVEVLSPSTEAYDRGDKFHRYCSLPSFCEYLLINPQRPIIDSLYRNPQDAGTWAMRTIIGLDQNLPIFSFDTTIPLSEIYRNTRDLETI